MLEILRHQILTLLLIFVLLLKLCDVKISVTHYFISRRIQQVHQIRKHLVSKHIPIQIELRQ